MQLTAQETELAAAIRKRGTPELHISRPIEDFLGEALTFCEWIRPDHADLLAKGIPQEMLDEFPVSISLGRKAESEWLGVYYFIKNNSPEWTLMVKEARAQREVLKVAARNAFGRNSPQMHQVARLAKGESHTEIVQELSDLTAFLRHFPDQLAAINFPDSDLIRSEELARDMAAFLASVQNERSQDVPERVFRDQVLMTIKTIANRIFDAGPDALKGKPDRLQGYKAVKTSVASRSGNGGATPATSPSTDDY